MHYELVQLATAPTREVFKDFTMVMEILFYVAATVAVLVFAYGTYRRIDRYRLGSSDPGRLRNLPSNLLGGAATVLSNRTIHKRDAYAGLMHSFVLWGFIVLFIGTVIIFIETDVVGITTKPIKALLEAVGLGVLTASEGSREFWQGDFYLVYSLVLDVFGLLFVVGVGMAAWRRAGMDLFKLDYARVDDRDEDRSDWIRGDWVFLGFLFVLGITGFVLEGIRLVEASPEWAVWSPVGLAVAVGLEGLFGEAVGGAYGGVWWFHGIVALAFVAYIPYSKAVHMFTSYASLSLADDDAGRRLPDVPEDADLGESGYTELGDFSWKHLLDADACTKCGRCHSVCPAREAGTALSPRDVVLDVRRALSSDDPEAVITGEVIEDDRLWACTTCRACVEECPVGIEHVPQIVEMRRSLVEDGEMDSTLQDALMNLMQRNNSFGESPKKRARWSKHLDFKPTDARKESVDYLWYVGDYASYDDRMQERTRKVATLLEETGVDFGILYESEANDGNDVRRVGEEGLWEMLAEENVETLEKCDYDRIVTTDPHALNTIVNEYPDVDADEIVHYSSLLADLIDRGEVELAGDLDYVATYHDPCYLGRYNEVYEPPREVIQRTGATLEEMPRNRDNSFCCGAGGGRIYMDTDDEEKRPSVDRIEEALDLDGVDRFVVACPKDMAMFSDAVKGAGAEDDIEVVDIIDLVEEDAVSPAAPAEAAAAD